MVFTEKSLQSSYKYSKFANAEVTFFEIVNLYGMIVLYLNFNGLESVAIKCIVSLKLEQKELEARDIL